MGDSPLNKQEETELLIRIDQRTEQTALDMAEIKKKLYGNGQPGLMDRTLTLEQDVKGLKGIKKGLATFAISVLLLCVSGAGVVGWYYGKQILEQSIVKQATVSTVRK